MSSTVEHHALTPGRERATLLTLCAVQFTHILDYMIMMPLGAQLMEVFKITPAQFTHLVAAYGIAAGVSGLAGGFVLDRFDRKRALLTLYVGFALATLACALAPNHLALLISRVFAGAFGGLAGSMVNAMVGDIIPPMRRGRAMTYVTVAFPLASVLGVPLGIYLAVNHGWHAPFFLLVVCAAVILPIAMLSLPHLKTAVHGHNPLRQMGEIVSRGIHLRAFSVSAMLVVAGGLMIPFIAPSFIINAGIDEKKLMTVYMIGGVATALSTPLVGWLSDHSDRLKLLTVMSVAASVVAVVITHMGPSSFAYAAMMMALFMVTMSGRFSPAMTMVTNAVEARYRGGFMSVSTALQQGASAGATVLAGVFVTKAPDGHLIGMPTLGYAAVGFFMLTVFLAAQLRAAAPHVAIPAPKPQAAPSEAPA